MDCFVCQKPAQTKCSACKNVWYCSVECQKTDWKVHKKSCLPYVIKKNEDGTEYFEATRDLPIGTVIFDEIPIFRIGLSGRGKCCLSCSIEIGPQAKYQNCSKCGWPICSPDCEKLPIHRENECEFFSSKKMKCSSPLEDDLWMPTGSRALMIQKNNKELWDYLISLGLEDVKEDLSGGCDDRRVKLIYSELKRMANVDKQEIKETVRLGLKLYTLFYTKGFPRLLPFGDPPTKGSGPPVRRPPKTQGFYLYKIAGRMTHSCSPNTIWQVGDHPDFKIRLRATVSIKKGEKLTLSKLHNNGNEVLGTIPRIEKLRANHAFFCKCVRCSSPSELESYMSAIKCDSTSCTGKKSTTAAAADDEDMNSGYLLPIDPLSYEKEGDSNLWKCNRCEKTVLYSRFLLKISCMTNKVDSFYARDLSQKSLDEAKEFVKKYEGIFLHPNHHLLLKTYIKILACLHALSLEKISKWQVTDDDDDCDPPYSNCQLSAQLEVLVEEGIRRSEFMLKVLDKILPGLGSYTKANTLKAWAFFKDLGWTFSTNLLMMDSKTLRPKVEQNREELQKIVDFYKNNLPSYRGQERCDEYVYFKSKLDSLEKIEKDRL